jgi:hypothetical protein
MANVDPANILVIFIAVGFFSFVVYLAVQGRKEEAKSKKEKETKE